MNNKITLYELLGLVKDGKAPKKIKIDDNILTLSKTNIIQYNFEQSGQLNWDYYIENYRLDEKIVEILEEEPRNIEVCGSWFTKSEYDKLAHCEEQKKIPEKIEFSADGYPIYVSCLDGDDIKHTHANDYDIFIANKINEIIDYLKSKGK